MESDQRTQKIRLTVIGASKLRKVPCFKTPICFAIISVDDGPEMKTKTSKGINPDWNESFELEVQASSLIKIAVNRTSSSQSNALIGEASLCLKDTLKDKHICEHTYQLCKVGSRAARLGNIAIRLELVENASEPEPPSQNQDPALPRESETPVTTSKESGKRVATENSSIPTTAEVSDAAEVAGESTSKLAQSRGASNAGFIADGMNNLDSLVENNCVTLVCGYIEKLTGVVDDVAEIHPYAKAAWSILGALPKLIVAQLNRDQKIQDLWSTASEMLDFLDAADLVIDEIQRPIVSNMSKQIHECALFVREYAGSGFCKRALRDTSSSESDKAISQYVTAFQQLKEQFKLRSSLSKLRVFREVREGLVEVSGTLQNIKEMEHRRMMESLLGDIRAGAECDENQACLVNTRVSLLDEIMEWVDEPGKPQYFWLHGPAGAGKSTVANTVVSRCKDLGRLGASFSFKRDIPGRNIPDFVIGTLAYQLAFFSSYFREQLCRAISTSGNISQQPLRAQLKKYIIAPMEELSFSGPIVIVIDALDECGNENIRKAFLEAWSRELLELPAFVKVLFVSRYEVDIRVQLELKSLSKSIDGVEGIHQDIMAYIENQMRQVHQRHPHIPSDWPLQDEKDELRRCADGLFIWVQVACEYIRTNPDPIASLSDMLSGERSFSGRPEDTIYRLYLDILRRQLGKLPVAKGLNYFQYIIGSVVVAKTPLTCAQLDSLLGLCPATGKDPLKLPDGSVIKISTSKGLITSLSSMLRTEGDTVRLLHASLADFLTDRERCTDACFFIDTSVHNGLLAFRCLETLQRVLKRDPYGDGDPTRYDSSSRDLKHHLETYSSPDSWYALQSWHEHLSGVVDNVDGLYDQARNFLFSHLLHFIEMKSLQGAVDSTFHVIKAVSNWFSGCSRSDTDNIISLLDDAVQLLQQFREPIKDNAAHIYISGIPFTAQNTTLFKTFAPELRDVPKLCSSPTQSPKLITLPLYQYRCTAISPDCTRLACTSRDQTLQIWDVDSCTPIRDLTNHDGGRASFCVVNYSPDGTLICAGDRDGAIYVWDAKTFKVKGRQLSRPIACGEVRKISFAGDLKVLALYGSGVICVWDIGSGRMLVDQQGSFNGLKGAFVTTYEDDRTLHVFHVKSNPDAIEEYEPELAIPIWTVEVSSDGQRAAFLLGPDNNPVIRIVNSYTGDTISSWTTIADRERSRIAFTDSGTQLVAWGISTESGHVRFYDVDSGLLVRDVVMSRMGDYVRVTADESRLSTWGWGRDVTIFDLANGHQTASFGHDFNDDDIIRYAILPSGNSRLVVFGFQNVSIWNPVLLESRPSRHVTSLILSPTSRQFAVAFSDDTVELSDFGGNPLSCAVLPGARPPFAFAPNGSQLVCTSVDNSLLCWNPAEVTSVKSTYKGHTDSITALAFSTDGTRLVTASQDSTIRIWDVQSESEVRSLPCNSADVVTSLALSSDESHVSYRISGSIISTLNAISGHIIGYQSDIYDTQYWESFSPEGKHIVCTSSNGQSCLRDGHTGQYLHRLDVQPHVTDTVFAHNTSCFATISELDIVVIMNTVPSITTTALQTLKGILGTITSLAFSLDGKYILVGTKDGHVSMSDTLQGVLLWEAVGYRRIHNMVFSSHGDKVAIISDHSQLSRRVNLLERSTGKLLSFWNVPSNQEFISVEFSPDDTQLIGNAQDHRVAPNIEVDDTMKGSTDAEVAAQCIGKIQVASHDELLRAYAHKEYTLALHDVTNSSSHVFIKLRDKPLRLPALSADGSILACVVAEEIWVWDTLVRGSTICQHKSLEVVSIISIEISPDAKVLMCCAGEKNPYRSTVTVVFMLDIMKNQIMARHSPGQDPGGQIYLNPGSGHIISTSSRGFTVWDALTENQLFDYNEMNIDHNNDRKWTWADISPDGTRMLLYIYGSNTSELWDIENYQKLATQLHPSSLYDPCIAFSPDGKYIAFSDTYSSLRVTIYDALTGVILCKHNFENSSFITSLSISMDSTRILVSFNPGNMVIGHIPKLYTSMHIVDSLLPSHPIIRSLPLDMLRSHNRWFTDEGKTLFHFNEAVKHFWARMGSDPRGLILELDTGEVAFLDLEDYLKAYNLGSGWEKGNVQYVIYEEYLAAHILANLSRYGA